MHFAQGGDQVDGVVAATEVVAAQGEREGDAQEEGEGMARECRHWGRGTWVTEVTLPLCVLAVVRKVLGHRRGCQLVEEVAEALGDGFHQLLTFLGGGGTGV